MGLAVSLSGDGWCSCSFSNVSGGSPKGAESILSPGSAGVAGSGEDTNNGMISVGNGIAFSLGHWGSCSSGIDGCGI